MAMSKRKTYLYKGREATRLRSSDKTYTFSSAGSQYVRQALEYTFLSGTMCKAFGSKAACDYAIAFTLGQCSYCGRQLIVCITGKLLEEGLLLEKKSGRPIRVDEEDLGWNIKLGNFQFDHLFPASEGGLAVKGNIVLACDVCNNLKSNMPAYSFIVMLHAIHDAQVRRGDKNVQPLFILDLKEHLRFFRSCVTKYYESSRKIGGEAIRLFDNATGFDSGKMMRELGHIDEERILGLDEPDSYALYPRTHELRDLPHMTNKELNDLAQEQIAANRLLSDDSTRSLSFDYTDKHRDRYMDWELSIGSGRSEDSEYKGRSLLSKAELQNIVRNSFGGLDLDADAERMKSENGDLMTGIYRSLEPVFRRKAIEDDRKNEENIGNENYRSNIYSQTKRTFETALPFLFRLDRKVVLPSKSEFKRLTGMDGSNPIPYDVWENLLFINDCLAATSNDDYLINMCNMVLENNWSKDDLMREFRNGNLARKEIAMHYANTPESDRVLYKKERDSRGYKIRSNFSNNVSARTRSWRKAWEKAFGFDIDYDGPTYNEMLRKLGAMNTLVYNDLEKPYNELRTILGAKPRTGERSRNEYRIYQTLEEKWIQSGILDLEHGLDGLNRSIDRYVESKDGTLSKNRETERNKFNEMRTTIINLLIPVIARKVADGGSDNEWAKRGWTANPPENSDVSSWPTVTTGYTSDNIGDHVESEWAKGLFSRDLDNTDPLKRAGVGRMIDSMNGLVSELANDKGKTIAEYHPDDREQSYIFWRMINEGAGLTDDGRRSWNAQLRILFNKKNKKLFRYGESGNGNSYDLVTKLSSFPNVDYVDLCEAMSESVGSSRIQFINLDRDADLVKMEDDLSKSKNDDEKTMAIMRTAQRTYGNGTDHIPYTVMSNMDSEERTRKYSAVIRGLKTLKFYLKRIHKEIPSLLVDHIPQSLMKMADYDARHGGRNA